MFDVLRITVSFATELAAYCAALLAIPIAPPPVVFAHVRGRYPAALPLLTATYPHDAEFAPSANAPDDVIAPHAMVFAPSANAPDDVIAPHAMVFVPSANAPDDVIAPHATVFAPSANAPDDVIAPHVTVFAPSANAPDDVIAPHATVFVPSANAPDDVIAPQANVPIPDTLPIESKPTVFTLVTPVNTLFASVVDPTLKFVPSNVNDGFA